MMKGLYGKIRAKIYTPRLMVQKMRTARHFKKYADTGKDFVCSQTSDCLADRPGLITIGNHCEIHGKLISMADGRIEIGGDSCIYRDTVIGSVESIRIGRYAAISNHVHIYDNNNHPTDPETRKKMTVEGFHTPAWRWENSEHAPIVIGDNVWIGEYSAILKGVTIGEVSIIACHSVVTKDVPPYTIAAGNPARIVKHLEAK